MNKIFAQQQKMMMVTRYFSSAQTAFIVSVHVDD
jgi:hypothetical protein